jgi:hypothetical protein
MNDVVKCAGEALCMQYALVNDDSFYGVFDINKIQSLFEDAYSHIEEYLKGCDDDEFDQFFEDVDEYIKENDVHGFLKGDSGPGRRERRFAVEALIDEMSHRL